MDNLPRIKRMSRLLCRVAGLFLWSIPTGCVLFWAFFNHLPEAMTGPLLIPGRDALPLLNRALCLAAALLPAGVAMYGFLTLRRLFGLYAEGEIFSRRNVLCYRELGMALLYWALATFLHTPLLSLALSVGMPEGQRQLTIGLDSMELVTVFAGLVALVISWVMDEGRSIQEEQALTI